MRGRRWVTKTLLLLFAGQADEELPLVGGAMPEDDGTYPRRWAWRGRGRVRLAARHAIVRFTAHQPSLPALAPARAYRHRSVRHLLRREGGVAGLRMQVANLGLRHQASGRLRRPAGTCAVRSQVMRQRLQVVSRGALRPRARALNEDEIRRRAEEAWLLLGD